MPVLMTDEDTQIIDIPGTGNFQFSAIRPENLGATEYTLATIVIDVTGSVRPFANSLLECLKTIITSCKKSPRSENLMVRVITFNEDIEEVHGFKLLSSINPDDYQTFHPAGMTALYDATYSGVGAILTYAKVLIDQDFDVNGCVYIITDGMDNRSSMQPASIFSKIEGALKNEEIESLVSILIGIVDPNSYDAPEIQKYLSYFKDEANLTQYIDAGEATPGKLAKLAEFVSESISSQSQALGSGAPSQQLTF